LVFSDSGSGGEFCIFGGIVLESLDEVFNAGGLSSLMELEVSRGGSVVRDIRYWKPWQPPLSTWIRRARCGFESLDIISLRRWRVTLS